MSKDKASVGDIENIGILLYEQSMILDGEKPSDPVNFSKKLIGLFIIRDTFCYCSKHSDVSCF